jgi:3alpha(or 20beta)-hydroxysteroid dehydrogenase
MFSIKDKVCVVTGCSQGIGLGIVELFVQEGAKVVMGTHLQEAEAIADRLGCYFVQTDVSQEDQVASLMQRASEKYGPLDVIINNAGILVPEQNFAEMDYGYFRQTFAVNVDGCMYGLKYGQKYMKDGGSIINTASVGGQFPFFAGYGAYCATKAAIISMTKTAAIELAARNIRVNCVLPGTIDTPMAHAEGCEEELGLNSLIHPLGRMGKVEEIAPLYYFLACNDCSFMTGSVIACDGGFLAGPNNGALTKIIPYLE